MSRPNLADVPSFYHNYINQVEEDNVLTAIVNNGKKTLLFFQSIPAEKWDHRYAEGKWSIKEMFQHIIDAERVFIYRSLCFARGEQASLPGFDENIYAANSKADRRTSEELIAEFETVRKSSEQLFASFDEGQINATGTANNKAISVNAIGFIIAGHVQHHVNITRERYL